MDLSEIEFTTYEESVSTALDKLEAAEPLSNQPAILIKPNLINSSPHPVTTPVACCEVIIQYIRSHSSANIVLAEGCGDSMQETDELFEVHGYTELARRYNIEL